MTRAEVETKIKEGGGSWVAPNQLVFTQEADGTIHVNSPKGMTGFLIQKKTDWKEFYVSTGFDMFDSEKMGAFIQFVKDMGDLVGVTPEIPGADRVVEKVLEKDVKQESFLEGKVKAYEDILFLRNINIINV